MTAITSSNAVKYVYDLPSFDRERLCSLLNENDAWEQLASYMKYDQSDIQSMKLQKSPCEELLTQMGQHNHTILELFGLLSIIKHYQTMLILKPFVDSKYHKLIEVAKKQKHDSKDLKIDAVNFNCEESKNENLPKCMMNGNNCKTRKILNEDVEFETDNDASVNHNNSLASTVATIQSFSNSLPHIPYQELSEATGGWNPVNLLGRGGFGTVYKGIWKNTEVAVKRIEPHGPESDESLAFQLEQSFREIKILHSTPHPNILALYASSTNGKCPCLIYQLMNNGSLEDRLHQKHNTQPLNWIQRFEIAKGIARGLQYLHTVGKKPLIHGDIKSANILLDNNFDPKIGDFGLARQGSADKYVSVIKIQGTRPYLPEEYIVEKKLSTKIDTYSYGIVLYELATGLPVYDKTRSERKLLKDYINYCRKENLHLLIDNRATKENCHVAFYFLYFGTWCSSKSADERPDMVSAYNDILRYESEMFKAKSF